MNQDPAREANRYDVIVVGAGHAGVQVVTELIQGRFVGRIAVLDGAEHMPYERPPLSKGFLVGDIARDEIALRNADFWEHDQIDLRLGELLVSVDPAERVVTLRSGHTLSYRHLVWCAGGAPRPIPLPGADLTGVHQLATLTDSETLRDELRHGQRLVVVGGGYIGLEVAAAATRLGVTVTLLEREARLLARVAGPEVSTFFQTLHSDEGVDIRVGIEVAGLVDDGQGKVSGVQLADGETIPADCVLVAIGLQPHVDQLAAAGAEIHDGVLVDELCRTTLKGVLAVGDCARFPMDSTTTARLESINNAVEQAKVAAAQILNQELAMAYRPRPWFWSHQYDTKFRSVGLSAGHDRRIVRGDPASSEFSVVYLRDNRAIAIDCINAMKDFVDARKSVLGSHVDVGLIPQPGIRLADAVITDD
ncbi:MAG: 3-phenylpropionate/trans-cinnamate dioxygenase ferredoxin reductase component [Nocardioidaceae bacterium]|nr:3-phenylpropionate/trans-cinnamate dioxygenase ferredoxin reductase component [Nocardioidaceae bacterium]